MKTAEDKTIIVAEISKNWYLDSIKERELLSQRFELVINTNLTRGYELKDWKITSFVIGDSINETIIAIFEKKPTTHE